jgi:hypothetical protein
MASVWFVRQAGKVYGPFDASRMKKLAAAGKILRDSGVAKQRHGPWTQASQVRGLFAEAKPEAKEDWLGLDLVEAATAVASKWRGYFRRKRVAVSVPAQPIDDSQWFYRATGEGNGEIRGPCSRYEMEQLVERGTVRASTLVLKQGLTRWETAFSAGLFLDDPVSEDNGSRTGSSQPAGNPSAAQEKQEEILWDGKASHHANYGFYVLCALAAPLIFPALWGLGRFVARDCLRYQITSRRVRVKHGSDGLRHRDLMLTNVRDAALVCPPSLQTTHLCNIELFGDDASKPLLVLEGVPLAESALVISLCEAAAHRHIPVRAKESLLADAKAQEEELLRRAELRHQREMAGLRVQRRMQRQASFIPPPPITRKSQHVSGLTSLLFGPRMRTIWVKGHYRGRKWIKPHKRQIRA